MGKFFRILFITILSSLCIKLEAQWYDFKQVSFPADKGTLVTDIAQDNDGNMWLASWQGLYKYDGSTFITYGSDPSNPASTMSGTGVAETVCTDRKGFIWIGTHAGLDRLDPQTGIFTHFKSNPKDANKLPSDYIGIVRQDHEGNIWVGTDSGLSRYIEKTGDFITYRHDPLDPNSLSSNGVCAIYEDKEGTLWIGTCKSDPSKEGGLNRMNKQTGQFTRYTHKDDDSTTLIDDHVTAIMEDSHGVFWVGTAGDGLHIMDRSTGLFKRLRYDPAKPGKLSRSSLVKNKDSEDYVTFITEDMTGVIWIGTLEGGLTRYDRVKGTTIHYNSDDRNNTTLFKDKMFWRAYNSKDGLLWMSTWEGNLYKIDPYQRQSLFFPFHTATNTETWSVYEENPGTMWVGTPNSGLFKKNLFNNTQKQFKHDANNPGSISNDGILTLMEDSEQTLWVGTLDGLNRFDPDKNQFTVYLLGDAPTSICEDHRKNLWIGTDNGGLYLMDPKTGKFKNFKNHPGDSTGIGKGDILSVYEDNSHRLWIGTWARDIGGGLDQMDPVSGRCKHYLDKLNIICIYQDKRGTLWVGTETGLFFMDQRSGNFIQFADPVSGRKIGTHILGIVEDNHGTVWIRSRDNIMQINNKRDDLKILGEEWGIGINGYIRGYAMLGQKGNVIFHDPHGYISFFPEQIIINSKPRPPILTELRVQNKTIKPGIDILNKPLSEITEIHLKYDQNIFSLDFKAVDYRSEGNNQFLYKLENYDNAWRVAGTERSASYYNIVPGVYIFRVKAGNSVGQWTERSVNIIISPPWWRTWWAYFLYALATASIAYVFYKTRIRKITAMYKMRSDIARDLHDEIGSTLTSINVLSKISGQQIENDQLRAKGMINEISEQSLQIQQNMSDIVWAINPENDKLQNMLVRMREYVAQTLEPKNINTLFSVDEPAVKETLNMQQRRDFFLIFKEAINNAAKYSACKNVEISLARQDGNIKLSIIDDGVGFDTAKITSSNGIKNMKARAAALHAVIEIKSASGEGTIVRVHVPLHQK